MSRGEQHISPALLHELLELDTATGKLFWRERKPTHFTSSAGRTAEHKCANWNSRHAGHEAFYTISKTGYRRGLIGGHHFGAARVVLAMVHGAWPTHHVDHINGVRTDDRPGNLRDVPVSENMRNRAISSNSSTGVHGVSYHLGKYDAYITNGAKKLHVGRFKNFAEAVSARKSAERAFGYHPNHGRTST